MGTNSEQTIQAINQGMGMIEEFSGRMKRDRSGAAEAALLETDARADAREAQRRAAKEASRVRAENERERSGERADWGGSNLAMSGSKAIVRDARSIKDMQEEEDVLFEGRQSADSILRQARGRANMLRINSGSSPERSTLSLGSSIYGPRR
ncbi:hypothetical protein [Pseudodesulfovibrio portus]|uniref:Uncharacterized protein n=1 Tax=Pseudodesulfovibrio portus TaxID=231439 RepID=A0ABM8ARM1_9BACT|nr:hypothetical protein [Pseudodesulfovibrio portus]BDQ34059.1 hypothetical protein JCM14722_16010 [Pseudodesulfovibrio portus]